MCTAGTQQSMTNTSYNLCRQLHDKDLSSIVVSVVSADLKSHFKEQFLWPQVWSLILQRYKPGKTFRDAKIKTKLQSFLGIINYLQPFLPGLPSKVIFLHEHITHWDWNPSTDQAFHCLKSWICNTLLRTTLAYYDCTQPQVLQTDAIEYSLSAVLLQNNRSIAFLVKHLLTLKQDMPI